MNLSIYINLKNVKQALNSNRVLFDNAIVDCLLHWVSFITEVFQKGGMRGEQREFI